MTFAPNASGHNGMAVVTHLVQGEAMRYFLLLLMLGLVSYNAIGCEADADVDDDGASLKVDTD
jgi:hypothetical protein